MGKWYPLAVVMADGCFTLDLTYQQPIKTATPNYSPSENASGCSAPGRHAFAERSQRLDRPLQNATMTLTAHTNRKYAEWQLGTRVLIGGLPLKALM